LLFNRHHILYKRNQVSQGSQTRKQPQGKFAQKSNLP